MESGLLSSMFQDGLVPFLDLGYAKDESPDVFKELDQSGNDLFFQTSLSPEEDAFPDWLDLKMDFSILEGLETPSTVLDDLLQQSEVGYETVTSGQELDVLPALPLESKTLPPLDLEQLSYEQQSVKQNLLSVPSPELDVMSPSRTPPPSSPDWIVPDVGDPDSPLSLLSPVPDIASHAYSLTSSVPSPPASVDGTVLTFVAPIVQPVTVVDTAEVIVEGQAVPLDNILSFSMLLGGINGSVRVQELEQVQTESSNPPSPVQSVEKPKRKVKAATNRRPKAPKLKGTDLNESFLPAPVTKKERKRKQNKDAAMRYRMKKRMETDTLADEETILAEENRKLQEKAQQLASELGYLKKLLREMFKARGLLK